MDTLTADRNQDMSVLDRTRDTCRGCGARITAGDVFCRDCE